MNIGATATASMKEQDTSSWSTAPAIHLNTDSSTTSSIRSKIEWIQAECGRLAATLRMELTFTWVDRKNKIGFSLPPKCASTTLRLIQMAKVGFIYWCIQNYISSHARKFQNLFCT